MPSKRSAAPPLAIVAALVLTSCKAAENCAPTDPVCSGGPGPIADITITSPVDTVMAVGRTATMTAVARDAGSNPVTVTFNWVSTNTSAATVVPASGVVTALAAGVTHIEARQTSVPAVFGDHVIRAVNADLPAVTALVGDSMAVRLRQALSTTPRGQVGGLLTTCAGHVTTGHVRALDTCLSNLTGVSGGADGNDNAVLGVLDLFFDHARRQLQL